jgi:hypothetical protein
MIPELLIRKCKGVPEALNLSANPSIEPQSIKSTSSYSMFPFPFQLFSTLTFSLDRTGTITVAPAAASVLVVSKPVPEYPPVTIATFPLMSIPSITSADVERALNPDPSGFCNAPL